MQPESNIHGLADNLAAAVESGDKARIRVVGAELRDRDAFVYSVFADVVRQAERQPGKKEQSENLVGVIRARADAFGNWPTENNDTIAAIRAGKLDAEAIKPHVRLPHDAYTEFYAKQSEVVERRAARMWPKWEVDEGPEFAQPRFGANINHAFRIAHAISLVEVLFGLVSRMPREAKTVRWMDIGCGTGEIANGVNPSKYGPVEYEIVGCDFQSGKINLADKMAASGRRFVAGDAFDVLADYKERGERFDILTMFEFLEHLEDPVRLLSQLAPFQPRFVLAGSPLEQKLRAARDTKPDPVHLWSFTRKVWEQMFALAGFEVIYSSEVRLGSYFGGLDWLSAICGPRAYLHDNRTTLSAQPLTT